ncbi:hypothetical protein Hanom_Chr10g00912541 [Helianthus anomalus]
MEHQRLDEEEAARDALDKGKNIADEEVLESSNQTEQPQTEAEANVENVEVHVAEVEANKENPLDPALLFTLKAKAAELVGEDGEDEDEEDDDFKDIDNFHESNNEKGDDDNQGGNNGAIVVSRSSNQQDLDFLKDTQNEEVEDVHPQGESSSGTKRSSAPKVIYLQHGVEEGELVEN